MIGKVIIIYAVIFVCLQSGIAISSGCSLELTPKLGGICDHVNNLFFSQKLRPQFGVLGETAEFDIDEFGNAKITATVLGIADHPAKVSPMKVRYEFKIKDIEFRFPDVRIECRNRNKCIELINIEQGTSSHIDGTGLICDDEEVTSLFESLSKLKTIF